MKKQRNTANALWAAGALVALVAIWQLLCIFEVVPSFMLPSPQKVVKAFITDFGNLMDHAAYTLTEAALGIGISIIAGFLCAVLMNYFAPVRHALYPVLVLTQTVPPVAIAPLLVLWFGFGITPKVLLIVLVCFFPITIGFLDGFEACEADEINLLKSMGASPVQIFRYLKFPRSLPHFFSGLRVSSSYCIVSAVIAEWLGGDKGLGVYLTRVRKSYAYDKMFAVIIFVCILSIALIYLISLIEKFAMPYRRKQ